MSNEYREPVCPFCWVGLGAKIPMYFDHNTGVWQCTRGNHTACNLEDSDEEAIRQDLMRMYEEAAAERKSRVDASRYIKAMAGAIRRSGGGSKVGRRRKKPIKRVVERPGTLA